MKKTHIPFIGLTLLLFAGQVKSQTYHEQEKACLRTFLTQASAEPGKLNLEVLGLAVSDTLDWQTSEAWVGKLKGCSWSNSIPKQITSFGYVSGAGLSKLGGELDLSDCRALKNVDCYYNKLSSLKLNNAVKLETIKCFNNDLRTLELSNTPSLVILECHTNQIEGTLDLSDRRFLKIVNCWTNQLSRLIFTNADSLTVIACHVNKLTELHISNTPSLVGLNCTNNSIQGELDLSGCRALKNVDCYYNKLSSLKLNNAVKLETIKCFNNDLRTLELSNTPSLVILECHTNQIEGTLDLSDRRFLKIVNCWTNQLSRLIFTNADSLTAIACHVNKLTELHISNTPSLVGLNCTNNSIQGELDLSGCRALKNVDCYYNKLSSLKLNNAVKLETIKCFNNDLRTLELSNTPSLVILECHTNQIEGTLDLSDRRFLKIVNCWTNQLSRLIVTNADSLTAIACHVNKLTELHISNTPSLVGLNCTNNSIQGELDLSGCRALKNVDCYYNKLSSLKLNNAVKLETIKCFNNDLRTLELSNTPSLVILECHTNQIGGTLDLSDRRFLKIVNCWTNQLSRLIVTNADSLTAIACHVNKLTELHISNTPSLVGLNCTNNSIQGELDLSGCRALKNVDCYYNKLSSLKLNNAVKLETIKCFNNDLRTFEVSNTPLLTNLQCQTNELLFSKLPLVKNDSLAYSYSPQKAIEGKPTPWNRPINLSSEYTIEGQTTTFKWFDQSNRAITLPGQNGKFYAGETYQNQVLKCLMTNAAFPGLTITYTTLITEARIDTLLSHFMVVETPRPDYYGTQRGETFKVYFQSSAEPGSERIGLFMSNGTFMGDITQSADSNDVYTCCISDRILTGNYILRPYTENYDGSPIVVERPSNSRLVDILPFSYLETSIKPGIIEANRQSSPVISNHMVLYTTDRSLMRTEIGIPFQLAVNTNWEEGIRIGLFNLYGELVEDITVSSNGNLYTCQASVNVYPNHYVLMPFVETINEIRIVERAEGTVVMDRLPIYVDYQWNRDVEFRKMNATTSNTGEPAGTIRIYPNPVSEILYIEQAGEVMQVEIYNLQGALVKKEANTTAIKVSNLSAGTYIIKLYTSDGIRTQKFVKR